MKHILRLVNYCKNATTSTQPTFLPWHFGLYQRPSSEEVCSIPLPVLTSCTVWVDWITDHCGVCQVSLNPVQVMSMGAEEEKAETARLVCDYCDVRIIQWSQ